MSDKAEAPKPRKKSSRRPASQEKPPTGATPKPPASKPSASSSKTEDTSKPKPPAAKQAVSPQQAAPKPQPDPAPAPATGPQRALVVDDEPANLNFLMRLLEQAQLEVQGASTAAEALRVAEGGEPMALVVVDNRLPDMDGIELMAKLRATYPDARIVMATMLDEPALIRKAFENGCDVYVVKPHGFMELFRRWQMLQAGEDKLQRLVIDHFGPRPFRS